MYPSALADNCLQAGPIYSISTTNPSKLYKLSLGLDSAESDLLLTLDRVLWDIALTPSGKLFAVGPATPYKRGYYEIYEIDACNGIVTSTGIVQPNQEYLNGMNYDPNSGKIIIQGPPLYFFDPETYRMDDDLGPVGALSTGDDPDQWCGNSFGDMATNPCDGLVYASLGDKSKRDFDPNTNYCSVCTTRYGSILALIDTANGVVDQYAGCVTVDDDSDIEGEAKLEVERVYGLAFDSLGRLIAGTRSTSELHVVDTASGDSIVFDVVPSENDLSQAYVGTNGFASVQTVDICQELPTCENLEAEASEGVGVPVCDVALQQTYCVLESQLKDPVALAENINRQQAQRQEAGKGKGGKGESKKSRRRTNQKLQQQNAATYRHPTKGGTTRGGTKMRIRGLKGEIEDDNVFDLGGGDDVEFQLGCCPHIADSDKQDDRPKYCDSGKGKGGKGGDGKGKGGKGKRQRD